MYITFTPMQYTAVYTAERITSFKFFLFLLQTFRLWIFALRIGCDILLWHSLGLHIIVLHLDAKMQRVKMDVSIKMISTNSFYSCAYIYLS